MDDLFPKIHKSIETLIEDEEGNIPGGKLLMLGTMILVLGTLFPLDAFAGHRSHRSHSSHSSHRSGSGSHESHVSHQSHSSSSYHSDHASHSDHGSHSSHSNHSNHASHTSHANTRSHSNSIYSNEGDVSYGPAASSIKGVENSPVATTNDLVNLPIINKHIEIPNKTPETGIIPNLAIPVATPDSQIDLNEMHEPVPTEKVE